MTIVFDKSIKKLFTYLILFLAVLGLHCCMGFSLVVKSRGYSLVVVHGLLIVRASLVAEHGLQGAWASVTAAHGLSSCSSLEHKLHSCGSQA